jgi:TonB family protein
MNFAEDRNSAPLISCLRRLRQEHWTGAVRVTSAKDRGAVYVVDGRIVHAECGRIVGEFAYWQLVGTPNPKLEVEEAARAQRHSITRPLPTHVPEPGSDWAKQAAALRAATFAAETASAAPVARARGASARSAPAHVAKDPRPAPRRAAPPPAAQAERDGQPLLIEEWMRKFRERLETQPEQETEDLPPRHSVLARAVPVVALLVVVGALAYRWGWMGDAELRMASDSPAPAAVPAAPPARESRPVEPVRPAAAAPAARDAAPGTQDEPTAGSPRTEQAAAPAEAPAKTLPSETLPDQTAGAPAAASAPATSGPAPEAPGESGLESSAIEVSDLRNAGDELPAVLEAPAPKAPSSDLGFAPEIVVRALVNTDGRVARVALYRPRPALAAFEEAALAAAKGYRFRPARRQGGPVPFWIALPVHVAPAAVAGASGGSAR